jgi:CHAD domain-containing protein
MTPPPATTGALAVQVLAQQANAFLEHSPGVRAGKDPLHVHQMRVATRRMRAALRLFKDVLPSESDTLNSELQWIASQLGPVRDLDVQLGRLQEAGSELSVSDALVPYTAWLEAQRQRAQVCLNDAMRSERFSELVQHFPSLSYEWVPEPSTDMPLAEDGPRRLKRGFKALAKRADPLDAESPAPELHKARIRAKRLRYAAEFFEPIYGKPAGRLVKRAVALQDQLGDLQDGVVGGQRIHQAVQEAGGAWPAETSLALGQVLQRDAQRGVWIRQHFQDTYAEVKEGWQQLRRDLRH